MLLALMLLATGLFAGSAAAAVRYDNYRGQSYVPPNSPAPNYQNYQPRSDPNFSVDQLQNLIDFAGGGTGNIASSGTDTTIDWAQSTYTLCNSSAPNYQTTASCAAWIQGRVTYALVQFPTAGTYSFAVAHDDEVKIDFGSQLNAANDANYRNFNYNVPVGSLTAYTASDTAFQTLPGNFQVSQANTCYVMRIYWNNQANKNDLHLQWTPPGQAAAIVPASALLDPSVASSYATCANTPTDLGISKVQTGGTTFTPGTPITYTITVWNYGPATTATADFSDTLPASLSAITFTCTTHGSAVCGTTTNNGNAYAVTTGALPLNTSAGSAGTAPTSGSYLTYTVTATPSDVATIVNSATITDNDNNTANDTSTATSTAAAHKNTLTKTWSGATAGNAVSLNITGAGVTAATAGTSTAPSTTTAATATANVNTTINLVEAFTTGTAAQYATTLSCVKNTDGTAVTVTGTGLSRTITEPADSGVKCTYTNTLAANVSVTKTGPATVVMGASYDYSFAVKNQGGVATGTNVIFQDRLPTGEVATASSANATCTPLNSAGATVTCTIPTAIAAGATTTVTLTVTAPSTAGTIINYAAANPAGTGTPVSPPGATCSTATTSCSSATTTVQASMLTLTKTHTGNFTVGTNGVYTLTVSNSNAAGTAPTTGTVTVTDTLPTGLTYVSAAGTGWTCSANGQVVTCTSTTAIAAGASAPAITLTVGVAAAAAPSVTNAANVSGGGDATCPSAARCAPTDPTTVATAASVSVTKTGPGTAVTGGSYTYTLAVANGGGTATGTNVIVQDQLPTGESATASTNATCTPLNTPRALLTCTIPGPIAAAGSVSVALTVTAPTTAGSITNYAATSPTGTGTPATHPGTACDTATTSCSSAVTNVGTSANVTVTKTGPATVVAGASYNYTLAVKNTGGTATSANVVVQDQLPTNEVATASTNATCTPLNNAGALVTCTIPGAIAANGTTNITLTVTAPTAVGSITNYAAANPAGDGTNPPTSPGTNCNTGTTSCSSAATTVQAPVLNLTKTHTGNFTVGTNGTYTLTASNSGNVPTTGTVTVTDTLPAGLSYVSGTGTGWTCSATGQTVTCTSTTAIAAGASAPPITLTVGVAAAASPSVTNTASTSGGGDSTCPADSHCGASDATTVSGTTSLTLSQTATVADTNGDGVVGDAGDVITYAFTATNTGTVPLTNVRVTDPLLPNLSCTIASLAAGASASCTATNNTYTVTAGDVNRGTVTSTATATGTPPGTLTPPTATNTLVTPTPATPVASFTITPTGTVADTNGDGTTGDAGDVITYTFSVKNTGTAPLTNVVVTDPLLPNLTCTIASLPVGATASCAATNNMYTITPTDVTNGRVNDTASATASAPTGVTPPPTETGSTSNPTAAPPTTSLTLSQTGTVADTNGDGTIGDAGDVITYAFTASNTGTVTLTNVRVTDPLLPNLSCTIASLAAGASASCAATNNTYTVTAGDVSRGSVTSPATATGTPPGTLTPPTATNTLVTPTPQTPVASFTVQPIGTVANTNGDGVTGDAGDVITYTFIVKNTGTAPLTNVVVTDPLLPNLTCTIASLPVGATASCAATNNTYTITPTDVTNGQVNDTASATASAPAGVTPPPTATGSTSNPTSATPTTSLALSQTGTVADTNGDGVIGDAGDIITYAFTATNTGTVPLTNVRVTDPLLPNLSCTIASLAVGASASCTATNNTYTVTAGDVSRGTVTSTATATGTPPGTLTPPTATNTLVTPTPATPVASFTVQPTGTVADTNGDGTIGDAGDVITYTFSVKNTGTAPLTNVVVTDPLLPNLRCTIASLPVGATASCTPTNNTYTITPADVTNGRVNDTASATASAPAGVAPPPTATGSTSNPTAATPTTSLTLSQTATVADTNGDGVTGDAGDVITYAFTAKNTGTVPLTNVKVTDPLLPNLSCTIASLAAGATASCTATSNTYTITASDVSKGTVTSTATVTGTPPGTLTPPTATNTLATPTAAAPVASFTITPTGTEADTNGDGTTGDAGDQITYTFSVKNTGTVPLTNVVVTDPLLPNLTCTIASLPVGATASCTPTNNVYTITPADVTNGSVVNPVSATASAPPGVTPPPTETGTTTNPTVATPVASFTLKKTATVADTNGDGVTGDAGDVITYTFTATNTGNVALTNIKVTDVLLPNLVCTIPTLAVGATTSCAATSNTYTITAADAANGSVKNTATATGTPPGNVPPPTTTGSATTPTSPAPIASFTLKKSATVADTNGDGVTGDAGDVITYTFTATNTGNVALTNIKVTDVLLPNLVCTIPTLAVGATTSCAATGNTYTITAADAANGSVKNTATATGTPPGNVPPPTTTGSATTPTSPAPIASFTLKKTATVADTNGDGVTGDAGDVITYTFTATNTGNVALTNIKVTDVLLPNLVCTIPTLAVGATTSCAATGNTYTITAADAANGHVNNTATATGTPPGNVTPPTSVSSVSTPTAAAPVASLVLKKTATVADTNGDGVLGDAGDVITYAFAATNTGTVVLTNVTVTDVRLPNLSCTVATLAVGATSVCAASSNTYVITAADAAAGHVDNTADAVGTPPTGSGIKSPTATGTATSTTTPAPTATVSLQETATVVDTNGNGVLGDAGDTIVYSFVATNTGTTPLSNVTVSDPLLPNLVCNIGTLQPGASGTCAATNNIYVISVADAAAGKVGNAASVTGTPPGNIPLPTANASVTTPTKAGTSVVTVTKQAAQRNVNVGDLVRYTVVATASGNAAALDVTLIDTPPAGFTYVQDSLSVVDADKSGTLAGVNPIRVTGVNIPAGGTATITYFLRVGAGVGMGVHTNQAVVDDASGKALSNVASAEVELTSDPLLNDSLIIGTVFDDRDGDGWQDPAKASNVHVQGGFAADVYVANSTTVDRGHGPQPEADHSAPMLHGLSLGTISGRSSTADTAERHQVVISQHLHDLRFTDDFVLTTGEGTTLRMNAAGQTTIERKGDARKGLTGQDIAVERQVSQAEGGYQVDYIIRDNGIEERGIPGVRVVSVEGLIMETDAYGRFNLQGIDGGAWARGRNFILKVDPSTLPPGSVFTTENPRVIRITPGVPVRFDFGVKLPSGEIAGGHAETDIALGEVLFAPGSAEVKANYASVLDTIAGKISQYHGGSVTITATAEQQELALARAHAVQDALNKRLDPATRNRLKVNVTVAGDASPLVSLGPGVHLGTVLFDTDQASIKPAYRTLLATIARTLDAQGGGVVTLVGRADHRGTDAYNTQLGLKRAKAVYEALVADLKPEVREKVRVEVSDNPNAPLGLDKR